MLRTLGIHHITAIASDPQANLDFYTKVLGLRFIKRTVNFDDPGSYHFYFGDEPGSPGTILTFFPWPLAKRGVPGAGSVTAVAFRVPAGSLGAWRARLAEARVDNLRDETRFGATVVAFDDPDGMALELVEAPTAAGEPCWTGGGVPAEMAIRGFHHATITVRSADRMEKLLTGAFGMQAAGRDGDFRRYQAAGGGEVGRFVDVREVPGAEIVKPGAGIVHHLAMRASDDGQQAGWARQMLAAGLRPTPVQDRNYFRSIYFREPQGVLFEIATDGPGFSVDEPQDQLGRSLKLPPQYEGRRADLERVLPRLRGPGGGEAGAVGLHTHVFEPGTAGRAVLLLHGTGGDEHDLLGLGRKVAPGASLLSPRGNVSEHGQNRFFRRFAEGVFDLEDLARRVKDLAAWLGAAREKYGITGALDALGFSNGANTAAALLLTRGPVLRRAVLLRGMVTAEAAAGVDLKGVRVLLVSGERDPIIPVENAGRLAEQLRRAGAEVRHEVLAAGHELTGRDLELAREWLK